MPVSAFSEAVSAVTYPSGSPVYVRVAGAAKRTYTWAKTAGGKVSAPRTASAPVVTPLVYPSDAGFIDVTAAPYNAVGDGIADDTNALLQAFLDNDWQDEFSTSNPAQNRQSPRTVYLPAGTYRVTQPMHILGSSLRIIGAGRELTTIKLADNAAGFQNAASPAHVLRTGHANLQSDPWNRDNAGFANQVKDLTIDVGVGNPGANGCRFAVANDGAMERVLIRSSDPAKVGKRGLVFETNPGSGLIQDVEVDGFDVGIWFDDVEVNDLTFSKITLRNQRVNAIENNGKVATIENLTVENGPAVAINHTTLHSAMILVNASISRTGTGTGTAITTPSGAFLHLRDVAVTGYTNIVSNGVTRFSGRSSLAEWSTHNYTVGNNTSTAWTENTTYKSLRLPIEYAPRYDQPDLAKWRSVTAHGATGNTDADDDATAINACIAAAIAAGQDTIYFPYGRYTIKSNVTVPTGIKKIDFCGSIFFISVGSRLELTTADTVVLENACLRGEVRTNTAAGTVVCRHFNALNSVAANWTTGADCTTATKLFIDDTGPHSNINVSHPISMWVRSWNRERQGTWTLAGGVTFWHIGQNIEEGGTDPGPMTQLVVSGGSQVEIFGGTYDMLGSDRWPSTGSPAHQITDSTISTVMCGIYGGVGALHYYLRETDGGTTVGQRIDSHTLVVDVGTGRSRVAWPLYRSP